MGIELTILYGRDGDGGWSAEIPEVPGASAQGQSLEEARQGAIKALREIADARREDAFRTNRLDGFERLKLAA